MIRATKETSKETSIEDGNEIKIAKLVQRIEVEMKAFELNTE